MLTAWDDEIERLLDDGPELSPTARSAVCSVLTAILLEEADTTATHDVRKALEALTLREDQRVPARRR